VSIKIPRAICTSAIRQLGGGALASPWTTGTGASVVIAPMVHAARVTHDACFPQARPAPVGRSLWSNGQPSADSDHSPRKDTLRGLQPGLIQKAVITRRAVPVPVYFSGKCCSYRRKELIESLLKHVGLQRIGQCSHCGLLLGPARSLFALGTTPGPDPRCIKVGSSLVPLSSQQTVLSAR